MGNYGNFHALSLAPARLLRNPLNPNPLRIASRHPDAVRKHSFSGEFSPGGASLLDASQSQLQAPGMILRLTVLLTALGLLASCCSMG